MAVLETSTHLMSASKADCSRKEWSFSTWNLERLMGNRPSVKGKCHIVMTMPSCLQVCVYHNYGNNLFTFKHVHVLRKPGRFEPQTGIMGVPNCKKEKRYQTKHRSFVKYLHPFPLCSYSLAARWENILNWLRSVMTINKASMLEICCSSPLCLRDRLCPVVNVLLKAVFARTNGEETPGDLGRRSDTCDSIGLNHAKSKSSAIYYLSECYRLTQTITVLASTIADRSLLSGSGITSAVWLNCR